MTPELPETPQAVKEARRTALNPRDQRIAIAEETLEIIRVGRYQHLGEIHEVGDAIKTCVEGTFTTKIADFPEKGTKAGRIHVTAESTTAAILRTLKLSGHVAALNFASARSPGGGFETGAQAQEECIARSSALYPSQISQQKEFYDKHIEEDKPFYSHRMIWSPMVPFFRDTYEHLSAPFFASVITAAAPNQARIPEDQRKDTATVFRRRINNMLALAANQDVDHLILGAWGCGVFGNNPADVAKWFEMEVSRRRHHFETITFAIFCPNGPDANLLAFQQAFPQNADPQQISD